MGLGAREPLKWWQMRTSMEKTLITFSILLTLTFIIVLVVEMSTHGTNTSEENVESSSKSFCTTEDCLITAGKKLSMMNSSANPCQDFYEFACGQYVKSHSIPLDHPEASVEYDSSDAVRLHLKHWLESTVDKNTSAYVQAKNLYKTCVEFDKPSASYVEIVKKIIQDEKIGNWPILDQHWINSDTVLEQRLASLIQLGVPVAFELQIVQDSENQEQNIVKISPGRPLFISQDEYEIRDNPLLKSYMQTVLLLLGVSRHKVSAEVEDILSAEALFIRIKQKADMECGDANGGVNNDLGTERMSLTEMDRRMPVVNWTTIMLNVFDGVKDEKTGNSQIVIKEADVYCRRYIREYIGFLEQLTPQDLCNYLGWRFLFTFVQHLAPPFCRLHSDYQKYVAKETPHALYEPRWKECLSLVEHYMLPVLANVYKEHEISGVILKEKMKIASNVRSSMIDLLMASKWLKEQDQQKIKQKVSNSKFDLPLSKLSSNWERIEEWFTDLNIDSSHHLIENVLKIQRFEVMHHIRSIIRPSTEILQWGDLQLTTSSSTTFDGNSIQIHYDKLRPPFLQLEMGSSMNYGGFGSYLSRTLLDYIISLNFTTPAKSERIHIFWEVLKQNKDFDSCFKDMTLMSENKDYESDFVNSALTDLSAVQVSHLAFDGHRSEETKYMGLDLSDDQMFFLSYAQAHCQVRDTHTNSELPSKTGVNFALRNFPSFGRAFQCPTDSPMNPSSKCRVFD